MSKDCLWCRDPRDRGTARYLVIDREYGMLIRFGDAEIVRNTLDLPWATDGGVTFWQVPDWLVAEVALSRGMADHLRDM